MLGGEAAAEDRGLNGAMLDQFNDQACWCIEQYDRVENNNNTG
jgi:hypothetical protein